MNKPILFGVLGVVLGVVLGMIFMTVLHVASLFIYPPPEGVDLMSQTPENLERLKEWMGTMPTGAFLLTTLSHGLGCLVGAAIAMLIAGRRSLVPAIVVGVVFTIGGILNLSLVPHPSWFPFVDIPIYLILAFAAGYALRRKNEVEVVVS